MTLLKRLIREEEGQSVVEYSLILAVIAIAIIAFGPTIKSAIETIWGNINTALGDAATESTP